MAVLSSSPPTLPLNIMVHMLTIKLTSSNYLLWRNQFVPLLASQELFGYLDGSITTPSPMITASDGTPKSNPAYTSWLHTDHTLLSLLYSSLTEESMSEDELQLTHRGSQSIAEFSCTFKGLYDQLAAIGRPIDDTDKVHWYLRALGPDYKIFSTTMMSQLPLPSFAEIVPKALSHEIFERSVSHSSSNSAYFVQQTSKVAGHKQVKHWSSASPTPFANSKSSSNSSVHCQLCDKEGHSAKRCWSFLKLKKKQSANLAKAFSACSIQDFNDSEWFLTLFLAISHTGSISSLVPSSPLLLSNVLVDRVTRVVLGVGRCENGLYVLDRRHHALVSTTSSPRASVRLWHTRLGHPHYRTVASLSKLGSISCSNKLVNNDFEICVGCRLGKSHRLPFSLNNERCAMPFDRLHCDLWGPSPVSFFNGYRYYAVFIDDCTRFSWIFPLKHKSDFFDNFINLQRFIETQFSAKIKSFQCDGGTEFTNNKFRSHLHLCGIDLRLACPYTPSQNGIAERKHRHVTETGLTLMFHACVSFSLWVEAFSTAVFLINRLPSPSLAGKTPYELLFGKQPDYSMLRTFGCLCFPYLRDYSPNKLSPKSTPCVFLGYNTLHKGFRNVFSSSSNVSTLNSLPSPSFSNSLCLLCNDIPHLSSTSSPGPQVFLDEDSLLDSVVTDSTTPSPVSSSPRVTTSSHPMITRGKAGIFKPQLYHAMNISSSS
ncbi:Retrovirus-related Pol polyprotein from transposon RE1 [Vitis vinifera]|uniref:Retrovirus-related Pol polyprotein from transposon RE1 n=1 Tax=Vitis vinifera TaxID=29760 RepID=A0A438CVD7_VITVI|nr:Retrovirus-related Pol polyprotein from transposon RE1 [Vitis vinifera]